MSEGVPPGKIKVIPLAYEPPPGSRTFARRVPVEFGTWRPLRVLFLGQVNLRKGVGAVFEAVRALRAEPIEFTFAGPVQIAIPPDLREHPQVRWVGAVSREDTARYYRDADLFLFPTYSDGFGLTQLEAQAWKLPIIASRCCGAVVEDGKNGCLLQDITPSAIVDAIRDCLRTPARLQQFSTNSIQAESFGLDAVGRQWLNAFE